MHTRASNCELVELLPEPECTLNRRLRRRNRRVPYDQRNNLPQHPRIIYQPVLNINHFHHFYILRNFDPIDDEPMWAADQVVAPTPGFAITILGTANEFAIKALFDRLLRDIRAFFQHENESLTDAWLRMKEMLQNCHDHNLSKDNIIKIIYHGLSEITQEVLNAVAGGSSNSDTDKIMARMDAITLKMDAQYKELQSNAKKTKPGLDEDDIPMSREEEAKFMQTFSKNHQASIQNLETKFDRLADKQSGRPSGSLPSNTQPNPKGRNSKAYQPPQSRNEHVNAVFTRSGKSYKPPVNPNDQQNDSETPINFDSDDEEDEPTPQPKTQNPKPVKETLLPKPYKPKIPKVPLILGRPFLHTTDAVIRVKQKQLNLGVGTERMIFNIDSVMKHSYLNDDTCFSIDVIDEILEEYFDALLDEEEPPFEKITINTDYKIKTSLEEPPTDLELNPLPDNLEYVFLEEPSFLPVIISSQLSKRKKNKLVPVLKKHKQAFS
ncbi:hypothetical protein Tco_1294983 [Tanacetum coccineum]